jgi:hypothetical protein
VSRITTGAADALVESTPVVPARAARANNIQVYAGDEIGVEGRPTVRVWRPEAEIFSAKSLATWAWKPVTIDHPGVAVDSSNYRRHVVGHVGSEVLRDGEFVRIGLMIADAEAQAAVLNGRRELSAGTACALITHQAGRRMGASSMLWRATCALITWPASPPGELAARSGWEMRRLSPFVKED